MRMLGVIVASLAVLVMLLKPPILNELGQIAVIAVFAVGLALALFSKRR